MTLLGNVIIPAELEMTNPGSDEALAKGCTCPVLDNNHGRFAPWPPENWWITVGCPVHYGKAPAARIPLAPEAH